MDSAVIPAAFEYVRVETPVEAFVALELPEARVIAGGHSLLPMMKLRLATPSRLVDIADLPWRDLGVDESGYRIGALTTYDELLRSARVTGCDALYECAARVGDLQVRNAGTLGGGLAHADPAADLAAGVLALEARMLLESRDGARLVPAADFFLGPFSTAMRDDELLAAIVLPLPARFVRSAYVSVEDPASGYPIAGAAARVGLVDGRVMQCSVGEVVPGSVEVWW